MGAGAEDALRAFHAFDFDANNAWKRYVASLEVQSRDQENMSVPSGVGVVLTSCCA